MHILITNIHLQGRSGTEVVVRDFALHLNRRGHRVTVFVGVGGESAGEIAQHGLTVIEDVEHLSEVPEIIHGQHNLPTMLAMARFPETPAVWMSHDFRNWFDKPPKLGRIHRYLAVDKTRWKYLVHEQNVPPDRVEILHNAVDLSRIPLRERSLPEHPRKLLAFTKTNSQLSTIEKVCAELGLDFKALGHGAGRLSPTPERELVRQDIVIGTGRSAIEALCAGAAVIVGDARGFGGLVTSANYEMLRDLNFGSESFTEPFSAQALKTEIARYDRRDALAVTVRIRKDADLESLLDKLETLYSEAIEAQTGMNGQTEADEKELQFYFRSWPENARHPLWQRHGKALGKLAGIHPFESALRRSRLVAIIGRLCSYL